MAKIRVYELARDLNMKSKALLEKLSGMNIEVGSHVSSLDDDVVAKIRTDIVGKPGAAEPRSKPPMVIRRRKKRFQDKAVQDKSGSAAKTKSPEHTKLSGNTGASAVSSSSEPPPKRESETADSSDLQREAASGGNERQGYSPESRREGKYPAEKNSMKKEGSGRPKSDAKPAQRENSGYADPRQMSAAAGQPDTSEKTRKKRKRRRKKDTPAKIIKLPPKSDERVSDPAAAARTSKAADAALLKTGEKSVPKETASVTEVAKESKVPQKDKDSDVKDIKKKKTWKKKAEPPTEAEAAADKKTKDVRWAKKKISFKKKEVVEGDALYDGSQRSRKGRKGAKAKPVKMPQKPLITTPKAIKRRIRIDDTIILSDLAKRMGIKSAEMIKKLMTLGVMATVNQTIDFDTAVLVASEFDYELERASFEEQTVFGERETSDDPSDLRWRSPVVTIMGHVDHGKTSLLDVIRKTKITEIEAGGITQHIGAYNVTIPKGQVTFLDTPGHEAFTAMRARGAKVTDIVVLVVAADDGVMPQTVEAINHSKAAGVPIIVAVNKIDKPNADTDRVYRELSDQGLVPEAWGGETIFVKVSAKQNIGIDTLLEMILLQAEVLELKANPNRQAEGYVVESKLDSGRGPVATVLIQQGTLKAGDAVVCGVHHGKIRAMINDRGIPVDAAGPSEPVEVLGLSGVPDAGDELIVLNDDKSARQVSSHRLQKRRSVDLAKTSRLSLEKLFEKMQQGEVKELNIIIKADVHGSIEALHDSLVKLSNEEVTINVIHSGTGTITESDISLAAVSNAIIIGFNIRPSPKVQALASEENVDMRFYNIIYNVIKEIQDAIVGMMESRYEERILGRAEVREVFHVPKIGAVAGCYVNDGKIQRGALVRLVRDGVVCFEGKLASLRRFKDDVKEVQSGYECGIGLENYNDIKAGDIVECYYLEEIKPVISEQ
ncbi:MAG: translation initiation factor IF-2 [Desulfobacteraceae bacterium IS3]|nr:MAG: translation initiation factor IF-2 [Desulfobacteraceae bacterium IS3]